MPLHAKKKHRTYLQDGCARRQARRDNTAEAEHRDEQRCERRGGESHHRCPLSLSLYFGRASAATRRRLNERLCAEQEKVIPVTRERSWKRAAIPRERGREKGVKEDDRRAREPGSDELARRFAFSHSSSCFSSPSLSPLSAVMPAFTPPPAPPPPPPRRGRREPRCELWILLILLPLVLKELPVPETVTLTPPSFQKQKRKTENKKKRSQTRASRSRSSATGRAAPRARRQQRSC